MRIIENLVFKGGGVLGITYAGAIEVLSEKKLLDNVKRVAGTSAGSIVATLLSLRYSASEITTLVKTTPFKKFEDHWNPLRIPAEYGLYAGDYFLSWIKNIIREKTGNENITFAEMSAAGFRDLKVFASDLNIMGIREFSNEKTPGVIVAESIRASMSIPLFFKAWKFPNNNPNDHIYVDGGVLYNYPITAFDNYDETLGFFIKFEEEQSDLKYDEIITYVKTLFNTLLNAQDIDFYKNKSEEEITVTISNLGISVTDFEITEQQKEQLFSEGKQATLKYIEEM